MQAEVVIITGSGGFIGSNLINSLSGEYKIIGLDKSPGEAADDVEIILVDITSDNEVSNAFSEIRKKYNHITSVVHLAAYYDFEGKPSPLYDEITVQGTERILTQLKHFEVDQFVFTSSMLVYKPTVPRKKIKEDWPLDPKWDYPESKVKTENLIKSHRGKIPFVNLRVAGVYNDDGNSIPIAHHIKRVYEKQLNAYFFPGNISHGNDYIHLDDLIDVIKKTIRKRKELPEKITLNISEGKALSYRQMQKIISKCLHGKSMPVYRIPKFAAKIGSFFQNLFGQTFIKPWMIDLADDHFEMDCSLAQKEIDWSPKHSLAETLPIMLTELKNNPDDWYKKNKFEIAK